jgi:hypothetical protein
MQENNPPKTIQKALRYLAGVAYEAELGRALEELFGDFQKWKAGAIDPFELSDRIHQFHDGPSRKIYVRYTSRLDPRFLVEYALDEGLIAETAVPREVWPYLRRFPEPSRNSDA